MFLRDMTGILGKRRTDIHKEIIKALGYVLGIFKLSAI